MPLPMSPQANDLFNLLPELFQPTGAPLVRRNALADQALAQAQMNVPSVPELGTAEFAALQAALMAPPQTVGTADREFRQFGAEPPPPPIAADQFSNVMNTAIPNLQAQGYRNIGGDRPPSNVSFIGTPEGFMAPSSGNQPGRDINELRMLDAQNKAAAPDGWFEKLTAAITGQQAPNQLSQQEQMMVDALAADRAKRAPVYAPMEERQKMVQQNAQEREVARNFRQEGPDAMMFAQLQQAVAGGGQGGPMGPPDQRLALLAPKVYAAQLAAWEASQNQQRLDQRDQQLVQDREEGRRQFDTQTGLTREGMAASDRRHTEEMDLNRRKLDPFGLDESQSAVAPAVAADQQARRNARDTALGVNVVERDKAAGAYSEDVRKELETQFRATRRRDLNPMTAFSPDRQYFDNQHFIQEMTRQGWSPDVIQQFLSATGRAVSEPNYPTPPTMAERKPTGGGSWIFPGL